MANFPPESGRNSPNGGRPRSLRDSMNLSNGAKARHLPPDDDDDWEALPEEETLEHTSLEEKEHILNSLGGNDQGDDEEIAKIAGENDQLRGLINELREQLDQATNQSQELWVEREREFESMLEEKSEKIRELYHRLQEVEQGGGGAAAGEGGGGGDPDVPQEEDLAALSDELERERCALEQERRTLEDDRRQLREDEESMLGQMRVMEMQMAKERAELARQRNELQRLHSEIRHELELAQRDAAVNERLRLLRRPSQDTAGPSDRPARDKGRSGEVPAAPKKKSIPGAAAPKKKDSDGGGLFGRFFNRDK